jgi:hypothetical protein
MVEFEVKRDPDRSNIEIARAIRSSVHAVMNVPAAGARRRRGSRDSDRSPYLFRLSLVAEAELGLVARDVSVQKLVVQERRGL